MKRLMILLASTALLTACSNDTETGADPVDVVKPDMSLIDITPKEITRFAEKSVSSGLDNYLTKSEVEAELEALDYTGAIEVTGDNGNFELRNIVNDDVKIESVTFTGLTKSEFDEFYFDSVLIEGLLSKGGLYDPDMSIDKIYINPPSHVDFEKMADSVDLDAVIMDDLAMDASPYIALGSGYLQGVKVYDEEANLELDYMGWMDDLNSDHISILFEDFKFVFQEDESAPEGIIEAKTLSFKNLDRGLIESMFTGNPFHYNSFMPYFDSVNLESIALRLDGFYISNDQYATWVTEPADGIKHLYVTPNPLLIGFDGEPQTDELNSFKEGFDKLGYDRIEIYSEGHAIYDLNNDSITSENAKLIIKDAMDIEYDIHMDGLNQTFENMRPLFENLEEFTSEFDGDEIQMRDRIKTAVAPLNIRQYEIKMTDKSLLDRIFNVAAEYQETDADTVREQGSAAVALMTLVAQSPYQSNLALEFSDAMGDFVEQGGVFKFSMQQDNSVDIVDVVWDLIENIDDFSPEDADPILKFLNMNFEHTPPIVETP